jgi:hypothetical protein
MRFFGFLILAAGVISGVFLFRNWRDKVEHQRWVDDTKTNIEAYVRPTAGNGSLLPDEAPYFKMQHFLNKAESSAQDIDGLLGEALEAMGVAGTRGSIIKAGIMEGYALLKRLKVFDDLASSLGLQSGEAPVVKSGALKDQRLVLSQILPAHIVPSLARHPANLRLMPEAVRDARDSLPPGAATGLLDVARNFRSADILSAEGLERLQNALPKPN